MGVTWSRAHCSLAVEHTKLVRELAEQYTKSVRRLLFPADLQHGTNFRYEYSPETFSQTETDYAVEVCEAVKKTWLAGKGSVWADGRDEQRIIFVSMTLFFADPRTSPQLSKSPRQTALPTKSSCSAPPSASAKSASSVYTPTTTEDVPSQLPNLVFSLAPIESRGQSLAMENGRAMSTSSL